MGFMCLYQATQIWLLHLERFIETLSSMVNNQELQDHSPHNFKITNAFIALFTIIFTYIIKPLFLK